MISLIRCYPDGRPKKKIGEYPTENDTVWWMLTYGVCGVYATVPDEEGRVRQYRVHKKRGTGERYIKEKGGME